MKDKTILIVEDDPQNLKLFRDILRHKGYMTLEATDGQQGVAMAKMYKPDLILMDMQLPVMDGIEATNMIKRDITTKDTVVVALTASAMPGDREKILSAGCHDYISKPVHLLEFLRKIAGYLDETE
jgi:CheY-like chemotaxis protein